MVNLQELVNQRNPVTVYSPARVLNRPRANAGTAQRILQSRAAPARRSPSAGGGGGQSPQVRLQLGQTTGAPSMPQAPMGGGSPLDALLAHSRQVAANGQAQAQDQGGWRGTLGRLVNGPIGQAIMAPLTALDYPRRVVASGIQEAADAFNGGDASWDDFAHQIREGIGFGDIIGSTGNIWADRAIGFIGDVALDPLTYVGGAGIMAGAGREARAGLAARVLEMGMGEELSQRVGRYGIHALSDGERQALRKAGTEAGGVFAEGAEKIKDAGYYFRYPFTERSFRLPGTATVDRFVGGAASRGRAGLAASPLGGWLRHRNADEAVTQALNRLVAGEGTMSLAAAAETYNWYQAFRVGGGMAKREAETALKNLLDEHGVDGLSLMIKQAEEVGGTPLNGFFGRMAKVLDDIGIDHGTIENYIPHYYTTAGKEWLTGKSTLEAQQLVKIFGAGNSLEDFSPSLMKRHIVARDGPYIINGKEFHITKGSIDEINSEFRRVTGKEFNLLEDNFVQIATRYSESIGNDVGRMSGVMRLLKSKTGLLRNSQDAEVLKAMVDDVATTAANDAMKVELRDQLNRIGEATDHLNEELAKGLHTVSSDLLKSRFSTIIDNLTSLTDADRAALEEALNVDSQASRLLGRTSMRGEANPTSALLDAFTAHTGPMLDRINALNNERANLMRAAALEQNQLIASLASARLSASLDELPRRLGNLQRYQQVTQKLMESQRDLAAIRTLQDKLGDAVAATRAAGSLANNGRFLTQFIPGESERIAIAQSIENQARVRRRVVDLVERPLDPAQIAIESSRARQALAAGAALPEGIQMTPRLNDLQEAARRAADVVDAQQERVTIAADALEQARIANGPVVAAAKAHNEGIAMAYSRMQLEHDSLKGEPGKQFEYLQLEHSMEEARKGIVADARRAQEQAYKPIKQAETGLAAEREALAKEQAKFLAAARQIDEEMAIPLASEDTVLPALPMTPEDVAETRRLHAQATREQREYEASAAGQRAQAARRKQAAVASEYEAVDGEIKSLTAKDSTFKLDAADNVIVPGAEAADFEDALAVQDLTREFDHLNSQLEAARADAKSYALREGASPGQLKRKDGRVRSLSKRVEEVAGVRDTINERLARRARNSVIALEPERTLRLHDKLVSLVERRNRLNKIKRQLVDVLDRAATPDEIARLEHIESLGGKLETQRLASQARAQVQANATNAEREAARRASALAARDRALGIAPRVDMPIARPNEARARLIEEEARRKLAQRERIIGQAIESVQDTVSDNPSLGLRALDSEDRFLWEHAQAIIRERDSFPGGESNKVVQRARRTIRELRQRVGQGTDEVAGAGARDAYTSMNSALFEIENSRTAWKPRKKTKDLMDEAAAGVRTQGGDNSVQGRARAAHSWGSYVRTEVQPDLIARGALPTGNEILRRPDIPAFMQTAHDELSAELDAYARSPSLLGELRLENAAAKVNRWSEFSLRYQAALDAGAQADTQTATFIWARVLGGESNNLGAQISNLEQRLAPHAVGPQISKMQERWTDRLPEALRANELSQVERDEVRFLNERYRLEDSIASDEETVRKINDRQNTGAVLTNEEKAQRTYARNRLDRDRHLLDLHNAKEGAVSPGPMRSVVEHIASIIDDAVTKYSAALNDTRLEEDAAKTAARMGEHGTELKVSIQMGQGRIEAYRAGQDRLNAAIQRAEAKGSDVVRWRPSIPDDLVITVDEAQRMLDNNELPGYVRAQVEVAVGKSRRRSAARSAQSFNVRDRDSLMARALEVRAQRKAGTITAKDARAELTSIRDRLDVINSYEDRFARSQSPASWVGAGQETGAVSSQVVEPTPIAPTRGRRVASNDQTRHAARRDRIAVRREEVAAAKGVHPDDVISAKQFVTAGPGGLVAMPIDEARLEATQSQAAISRLEASLADDRLDAKIIDGTINEEIAVSKAIIADQMGAELPDVEQLQGMLDEINARATERRGIHDNGARLTSFEALGDVFPGQDIDAASFMTPEETEQATMLGQRIAALQRFGRMTPEQLADANKRLEHIAGKIRSYERKMGSRFDAIDAVTDSGQRYFNSLLDGTRQPTTKDVALMRDLLGSAESDVAVAFVTQLNELLGVTRAGTRSDLELMMKHLGAPPIEGEVRSLLFEGHDPSRLELDTLRRAIHDIPAERLTADKIEAQQGWLRGLDMLTNDPVGGAVEAGGRDAVREMRSAQIDLSPAKLREVFGTLGASFGDTPLLADMRQVVVDAEEAGIAITNGTLRDVVARTLITSAKQHEQATASDLTQLINALGLRFNPGMSALSSKLSAMGYVMGGTEISQTKLREFITRQLEAAGIPLDGRLDDQLTQLRLRKGHVDSMRIGLGADLKDLTWDRDPRLLFEATSKPHFDKARQIETEIQTFNGAVVPQHVDQVFEERIAELQGQLRAARAAGDTNRESEIYDLIGDLDGRRMADPETPPAATMPAPEANPQATFEAQIANVESQLTDAAGAVNKARTEVSRLEAQARDGLPPEYVRHPDTPEGFFSYGELMAQNAKVMRAADAGDNEAADALGRQFEHMMAQRWTGEPEDSVAAVKGAGRSTTASEEELTAARNALTQAEHAHAEAEQKLAKLRTGGPDEVAALATPENSLGAMDDAARASDPDAALTFEQANNEYEAMMSEVRRLDAMPPSEEVAQQRAMAAARARKMADQRSRVWPARRAQLEAQRSRAYASATNMDLISGEVGTLPPNTATWNVWQTMTTGAPNVRYFSPPPGTKVLGRVGGINAAGKEARKTGMIVNALEGLPASPAGRYTRSNLPGMERALTERLAPAEEVRQSLREIMLEARNEADALRVRINQHLDAYDGKDIDGEIARLTAEQRTLEQANARPLGEAVYAERAAEVATARRTADEEVAQETARIKSAIETQREQVRQAQREYTDMVRSVDPTLALVRDKIGETAQRIHLTEGRLKKYKILDYQGVSREDMEFHATQLRDLNRSVGAATPEMAADIAMVETLLDAAMLQTKELAALEPQMVDVSKRLHDFETGAESVGDVIKHQLADGWQPMFKELIDPDGPDAVVMADELSRAITNLDAALRRPETWGLVDQFTRLFKTYATATPGFHVRNLMSGIFMNLVDNVRVGSMVRGAKVWHNFISNPTGYLDSLPPNSDERRALMVVFGSGASGVFLDTGGLPKGFGERGSRLMNNPVTRWNQRTGSRVEGTLRLGMALDSMAKGQNMGAALERVTRYHFDYSRLSSLDHTARRLIPFWTFLSRNIPLQIESMWQRPRTYLQYQSFVRNFGEAADPLTPDYWLAQGAFTLDEHADERDSPWYLAPDLPFTRVAEPLEALSQGDLGRALLSNLNPIIGAPVEAFAAHRKFYSGAPVEQEYNEPSAAMKAMMPLFALLGGTQRGGESGDLLLDDRYAHVARSMLPTLNLVERLTDDSGVRAGRNDETFWRALGAPVYQLTPELRQSTRRQRYYARRDERRSQADLARK
jgi:hypothetical protein